MSLYLLEKIEPLRSFKKKIKPKINIKTDTNCAILMFPSIKLSVLKPSTINLSTAYNIRYKHVVWPNLVYLLLLMMNKTINRIKQKIDSIKNVGT